ncbi:hypothetical protein MGG_16588 [Pyricularia oryzae 70-15]|uniref:Uncharacterized protein n=3 Tax=Pyricularia oryzae TaxID=318829 RepID=G4MZT7_PYRO7|nr:uncharacterized protein MGG_16588 [Pyricularia oryzae 70-15]EHA51381.1 hypothetical protein MGG_16588 [Pyricularia oryzae 70-15]ELQ34991.1 hypothetical protein OOU_Y34scaffold00734g2 [Pyricularia oryzae Y34]
MLLVKTAIFGIWRLRMQGYIPRPASKDKSAITAATPWRGTILFPLPLIPGTSRNAQGPVLSVLGRPGAQSRWCNTRIYNGYRASG